jgi:hypothetical protein
MKNKKGLIGGLAGAIGGGLGSWLATYMQWGQLGAGLTAGGLALTLFLAGRAISR